MEDRGEIEGYFPDEGRLGLSFAPQERGNPASPATVTSIEPPLAARQPHLREGLVLVAVQGEYVEGMSCGEAIDRMKASQRPLTLTFAEPPQPRQDAAPSFDAQGARANPPPRTAAPAAAAAAAAAATRADRPRACSPCRRRRRRAHYLGRSLSTPLVVIPPSTSARLRHVRMCPNVRD